MSQKNTVNGVTQDAPKMKIGGKAGAPGSIIKTGRNNPVPNKGKQGSTGPVTTFMR